MQRALPLAVALAAFASAHARGQTPGTPSARSQAPAAAPTAEAATPRVVGPGAGQVPVAPARRKPLAALSASAERLRDSAKARLVSVESALTAPLRRLPNAVDEAALRDSIVTLARAQLGKRYRLGAETPSRGFDCSGLVKFVLSLLQLELPRTARGQSLVGMPVERDTARLRPGDLVTFGPGKRVTHIGIYVGDGRIVHASVGQRAVVEATMTSRGSWFARHWLGARRLLALADSTH